MVRNFSQFLLEKETKGLTQWDPDGKDPWFYRYVSEITGEEIKITEDKLKELGKKGNDIEQGSKWEELYQFAKYCLTGKKTKYTDKKLEKLFVENIRDIKIDFTVKEKNKEGIKKSSTIGNLLDKNIDSNEIKPATKGIYSNILEYIKNIDKLNPSEIVVTFVDAEGMKSGFDINVVKEIKKKNTALAKNLIFKVKQIFLRSQKRKKTINYMKRKKQKANKLKA
jgi:hypothetical protein